MAVLAILAVLGGVGTSGDHQLELLALECVASTVGPACGDDLVFPFLEQRGGGVPVERELQHDAVMRFDELLVGVDGEVRIFGVFVAHDDVVLALCGEFGKQTGVHSRAVLQVRMEYKNQR